MFKEEMDKVNDALTVLKNRVSELEKIEKDLNAEIERKTQEWQLLEEGKNKELAEKREEIE